MSTWDAVNWHHPKTFLPLQTVFCFVKKQLERGEWSLGPFASSFHTLLPEIVSFDFDRTRRQIISFSDVLI